MARRSSRLACLSLLGALLLVRSASAAPSAPTVKSFFSTVWTDNQAALASHFGDSYRTAVDLGMPDTPRNKTAFLQAMLVYHLVKTGGVLGNAFIIREDDGRHPDTMLRDAFAPSPLYKKVFSTKAKEWNGVPAKTDATLFAFGRCDEFEMLEASLLKKVFGLAARVAMVWANHVVTEVVVDGGYIYLDSSFQLCIAFSRRGIVDAPPEDGVYSIDRVNRIALRDLHADTKLDPTGATRVRAALAAFLDGPPPAKTQLFCSNFEVYGVKDHAAK